MTKEKVIEVLRLYKGQLEQHGYTPHRVDTGQYANELSQLDVTNHLLWMSNQQIAALQGDDPNVEKAMRWLGFMQGVMYAMGYFSIDDLKDHNKGDGQ